MVPDALTGGPRFAAFCEKYIRHTKGRWAGRPFILEDWQREFWWEALEVDPRTGLRIYQEVGLGLPRKNGKSVMASAAGHYFLVADGEAEPEVYAAAAARNQAGIVLGQARRMALQSPALLRHVAVRAHLLECPRNGGIMRALSADAALQHGLNPSANIIDELHAHKNGDLYTALTTGTGAREQPFTLWITTGGEDASFMWDLVDTMETGPGTLEDRGALRIYRDRTNGVLIWWYGAPAGADIHDPTVWRACNPASWLQDGHTLEREHGRLLARGAMPEWRMYHLNQRSVGSDAWMAPGLWASRAGEVALDPREPAFTCVRVGHGHQHAAMVTAQVQRVDGRRVALNREGRPVLGPGDRVVIQTKTYAADGTGGQVSLADIERDIAALRRAVPAQVRAQVPVGTRGRMRDGALRGPEIAYAGAFFAGSAQRLRAEGVALVDVPSTPERLAPAAETLMQHVSAGTLVHDGDAELARQLANVVAKPMPKGWKPEPLDPDQPIVAARAAMLAVHHAITAPRWRPSTLNGL